MMEEPMIAPRALALVGMTGSGKTLCAQHLVARGFAQFRLGGIVIDEVTRRGWDITPENERIVREELRAGEGINAIAQRALPHLRTALAERDTVVIDGVYGFGEYKLLRQELAVPLVVVAVVCARHRRYQRLASRPERPLTPAEAEARDFREIEHVEKGGPIAIADYTLLNDGAPADLLAALDALTDELGFYPG
jgi:dephospho-CoA kinase